MRNQLMRLALVLFTLFCGIAASLRPAAAMARISVNLTTQSMHVDADAGSFDYPISSARAGFSTPRGYYKPQKLVRMHYSKKYHNSPMPYSIFFRGGYAIHGTGAVSQLGRPASHGCIRLSPVNAASLYEMVKAEGARIAIAGTPPASRGTALAARHHHKRTQIAAAHRHHNKLVRMASHHRHPQFAPALAYAPRYRPLTFPMWLQRLPLR